MPLLLLYTVVYPFLEDTLRVLCITRHWRPCAIPTGWVGSVWELVLYPYFKMNAVCPMYDWCALHFSFFILSSQCVFFNRSYFYSWQFVVTPACSTSPVILGLSKCVKPTSYNCMLSLIYSWIGCMAVATWLYLSAIFTAWQGFSLTAL